MNGNIKKIKNRHFSTFYYKKFKRIVPYDGPKTYRQVLKELSKKYNMSTNALNVIILRFFSYKGLYIFKSLGRNAYFKYFGYFIVKEKNKRKQNEATKIKTKVSKYCNRN